MFSDRLFSICVRQETQNIDFCCFCCTSVLDTFLELLLVDLKYGQILASILCKFIALTLECMCAVNITCVICPLYFTVFFQLGLNKSDSIIDIPKGRPQRGRLPYIYIYMYYIYYIYNIYYIIYMRAMYIYI